ncbi:CREB1 protein, partial [Atractosteus spatula]|nr:CREB1 protein [Atractosteus spatula]
MSWEEEEVPSETAPWFPPSQGLPIVRGEAVSSTQHVLEQVRYESEVPLLWTSSPPVNKPPGVENQGAQAHSVTPPHLLPQTSCRDTTVSVTTGALHSERDQQIKLTKRRVPERVRVSLAPAPGKQRESWRLRGSQASWLRRGEAGREGSLRTDHTEGAGQDDSGAGVCTTYFTPAETALPAGAVRHPCRRPPPIPPVNRPRRWEAGLAAGSPAESGPLTKKTGAQKSGFYAAGEELHLRDELHCRVEEPHLQGGSTPRQSRGERGCAAWAPVQQRSRLKPDLSALPGGRFSPRSLRALQTVWRPAHRHVAKSLISLGLVGSSALALMKQLLRISSPGANSMTMESGADTQQGGDTAVAETDSQQIGVQAQPQIAALAQVSMAAGAHTTSTGPTVTLVQLPNGQTVQVHGVIQAAQPSVIQSPQVQTVQISTIAESEDSQESVDSVTDSQKRREILSRRPSYRKILNDLSSDAPGVPRIEEEKSEEDSSAPAITTVTVPTPIYQTSSGQYIAITQGGAIQLANNGTDGVQGLQTLTMTNAAAAQPGTTILQYAQTTDGQQILVPSNQVVVQAALTRASPLCASLLAASGDVQAYQIRTAPTSTIAPGVVMASSPALPTQQTAEEAARKREVRLMKNREAARECRRKKKEYVKCLENRVAVLENQNKTLIEELKALKDLYCHKSD